MTDLTASSLRALKLMDLTTLNDDDTNEKVIALCHQAKTPVGNTAAVCIYPRFIPIARKTLNEQGTMLEANLAATVLLGTTRRAAGKQKLTQFILPEDQDIYYRQHRLLLQTDEI